MNWAVQHGAPQNHRDDPNRDPGGHSTIPLIPLEFPGRIPYSPTRGKPSFLVGIAMRATLALMVGLGLAAPVLGQLPATPVPVAPPTALPAVGAGGASAGTAPAAAPRNIFTMFCPTAAQKAELRQKFCNSVIGKLFNTMITPLGMMTGGLLGSSCSGPSPADLAKPATSAEGAAARIKADEANAAARRAAVRYLGTVSCKYYPEAEPALISSLRGDPSECVRIEAAKAFANGCCCSKKTIAALTLAVNGGTKDGFPSEQSECVRALAFVALQVCVATYQEPAKPPEKANPAKPEKDAGSEKVSAAGPNEYYNDVSVDPPTTLIREARMAVARGVNISRQTYRQITAEQQTLIGMLSEPLHGSGTSPSTMSLGGTQVARSPETQPKSLEVVGRGPNLETQQASPRPRNVGSIADLWKVVSRP